MLAWDIVPEPERFLFMNKPIDCRSEEGITVGLIDGMISIARILKARRVTGGAVEEALKDFAQDEDILAIFNAGKFLLETKP